MKNYEPLLEFFRLVLVVVLSVTAGKDSGALAAEPPGGASASKLSKPKTTPKATSKATSKATERFARKPASQGSVRRLGTLSLEEEQNDRAVDAAAVSAQEIAIKKLSSQAKRHQNQPQEPEVLFRLADLQFRTSKSYFRLAYGGPKVDSEKESRSKILMQDAVVSLTRILEAYPKFQESPKAMFLRAKAYRELGDHKTALSELLIYAQRYPNSMESALAHIYTAEIAIDAEDYRTAIERLLLAKARPADPHYAYVLDKLAWSYFNVEDYPNAVKYKEQLIRFERNRLQEARAQNPDVPAGAFHLEEFLVNLTFFYAAALEKKHPSFQIDKAFTYFRTLESGNHLGKMLGQFSLALRAKNLNSEIAQFKDQVVKDGAHIPGAEQVLVTTYEAFLNWRDYRPLPQMVRDFNVVFSKQPKVRATFVQTNEFKAFRSQILEVAESIAKSLGDKSTRNDHLVISAPYTVLLISYLHLADPKDVTKLKVRFRLGEHYAMIGEFEKATTYFRWIVDGRDKLPVDPELYQQAEIRAIATRYEVLKKRKVIPEELVARKLDAQDSKLDAQLGEWIRWMDRAVASGTNPAVKEETFSTYEFEANRALYEQKANRVATARLMKFVAQKPKSKFAAPSASLVIDTYIASESWESLHKILGIFLANDEFVKSDTVKSDLGKRLPILASDTYFKMTEGAFQAKDYAQALKRAEEYLKLYPSGNHRHSALALAGKAAVGMERRDLAIPFFQALVQEKPTHEAVGVAYLVRAQSAEDRYDFGGSFEDYLKILSLPESRAPFDYKVLKKNDVRKSTLKLATLSQDPEHLRIALKHPEICGVKSPDLRDVCERAEIQGLLESRLNGGGPYWSRVRGSAFPFGWMVVAAAKGERLSRSESEELLRGLATQFSSLDGEMKLAVLSGLSQVLPKLYQELSLSAKRAAIQPAPEKLEASIRTRVNEIQKLEKSLESSLTVPLASARALALMEIGGAYQDLGTELRGLKPQSGFSVEEKKAYSEVVVRLAEPFEAKSVEILQKAFEIASESGSDSTLMAKVSDRYFRSAQDFESYLRPVKQSFDVAKLDLQFIQTLDPLGAWSKPRTAPALGSPMKPEERSQWLKHEWGQAIQSGHYARMSRFLGEAEKIEGWSSALKSSVRAVMLARTGTQSEGYLELKDSVDELLHNVRARGYLVALAHTFNSLSKAQTRVWLGKLFLESSSKESWLTENGDYAALVYAASKWSGYELSSSLASKLLESSKKSQDFALQAWTQWAQSPESQTQSEPKRRTAQEGKQP